jgi:hypothetical protein
VKLLNAAEKGSVPHIRSLSSKWPQDIADSERALAILLFHFKEREVTVAYIKYGRLPPQDAMRASAFAWACMTAMDGAFKFITEANEEHQERMLKVLLPHLENVLAWLEIFSRNASILSTQPPDDTLPASIGSSE